MEALPTSSRMTRINWTHATVTFFACFTACLLAGVTVFLLYRFLKKKQDAQTPIPEPTLSRPAERVPMQAVLRSSGPDPARQTPVSTNNLAELTGISPVIAEQVTETPTNQVDTPAPRKGNTVSPRSTSGRFGKKTLPDDSES